jgi:hypothetical protein
MWHCVDARSAPYLNLELVCGDTQSSGCRQRLRTRRWGQFFGAPLGFLELFTRQSTAGPQEVAELEVRERLQSMLRNVDGRPLGGDGAGGPGAPTINAKKR